MEELKKITWVEEVWRLIGADEIFKKGGYGKKVMEKTCRGLWSSPSETMIAHCLFTKFLTCKLELYSFYGGWEVPHQKVFLGNNRQTHVWIICSNIFAS